MAKILIVDDEPRIRELIREHLQYAGYTCEEAADGSAALAQVTSAGFDLVILDLMMPFMDGMTCLREMRSRHINTPVIILTARGEEYDKITGLDSGADDYLVKPFGMMEMVSRVRAVLRRANPERVKAPLSLGGVTLDPVSHRVTAGGEEISLTLKEFELLHTLMSSPGVVFTRDRLLSEIWGTDYDGETRTVDVHVRTLRQKLGEAGSIIGTVRGVGYRTEA